jgi:hypothetical protein
MKIKIISAGIMLFAVAGCFKKPTDHDLRVAAKKIIRKELTDPSAAKFAPDNKIKIVREKGDKTFYISIYEDAPNALGAIVRKEWNLHLLYKGGSLPDINNWKVLQ